MNTTTNENAAMVFSTDANGIIQLYNIPIYFTYYIQEVGVPPSLQDYYKIKGTVDTNEVNDANEVTDAIEVTDSIEVTDNINKISAF